ncbi:MAG TPA: 16S rRNA (cytidine(1402)-2'-O)-methyltransferase [Patescibacteria group bacterium]
MTGKLFIVSTPIGNLKDISLRAIETLTEVDLILSEDTRHTGMLLKHLEIQKPQLSYFEYNEEKRIPEVIRKLKSGLNIALVSDAGTPLISDPGFKLVREVLKMGLKVESIPGASAILTALTSSGLPTDKFLFLGYLPKKGGKKEKLLKNLEENLKKIKSTVVIYEAPHRLVETLESIQKVFGVIEIVIASELTKIHEEVKKDKITGFLEKYSVAVPRGEYVILI